MYLKKIYPPIQWLYPQYTWRVKTLEKKIFLTFDDGPCPDVTDPILDILDQYQVKATFFCIGREVDRYPDLYQRTIAHGHRIGNHSYSHISGYKMSAKEYVADVAKASKLIESNLYRPPYGKMKRSQSQAIAHNYKIMMWDIMPGDFDPKVSAQECYKHIISGARPGSIIVLHDNLKSKKSVLDVLPRAIEHLLETGYAFDTL